MSRKRAIALIAVLVLAVAMGGCLNAANDDDGGGPDDEAEALGQAAVEDMEAADTYTITMETEASTSVEGEQIEQTIEAEGVVDRTAQEMHVVQNVSSDAMQDQTVEMYVLDDSAYVEQAGAWQTQPLPTDPWEGASTQQQVELLEDASVNRVGTETVDGVETAVLEVDASPEQIEETASEQMGGLGGLFDSITVESATIEQYVAVEEPHYVYRIDADMTMTFDNPSGENLEIETTQTVTFDDYEEDVSVDVPEDLRERHES